MARKKKISVVIKKPFRVMDLPPEIRNRIWRFAVITDQPIEVRSHWKRRIFKALPPITLRSGRQIVSHCKNDVVRATSLLAIASTCRQVYLEVTPIYYSQNVFRFCYYYAGYGSTTAFTGAIGKEKAQSITSAILRVVDGVLNPEFSCLPGLQRLEVQGFIGWPDGPMERANRRALDMHAKMNPDLILTEDGMPWQFGN